MEREKKKETEKNSKLYHVLKIPTFYSFCESSFFFSYFKIALEMEAAAEIWKYLV